MAIALEGTPTLYENASSVTALVPYPAGIVAGELLLIHVSNSGNAVPATPAGWTLVKNQANTNGTATSIMTAYKIATGSETGTVSVASNVAANRLTGMMERFSGVDTTTPIDVAASSAAGATGASWSAPSITTVTAGAMLVAHTALNASSTADITHTAATMTSINATTGTGRRTRIWTEPDPVAGATGTRTFQSNPTTTLQWTVALMALRPGASGPATPVLVQRVVGIPAAPTTDAVVQVKTTDAATVRLKCSTDAAGTTGVVFGPAVTPSANGDARLTVTGLTPNTRYYYRVAMTPSGGSEVLDTASTIGRLKTAPSGAANFAFDFGSCTNATDSASMTAIAARGDDLFFHLGDLFYADASGTGIANFRDKMNAKITAANHAAVFATMNSSYTPSDHDGMNNNGAAGNDATAWTNWNTARGELFPMATSYYAFTWGRVRFIQIDTRSFKSPTANTDNSSKTALGTTQKTWFKNEITNATEPLIVVIQSDPWIGTAIVGDDSWPGFTTERTELANHFAASGKNIIMLAGDMHAVAADNGTNAPGGIAVFHAAPFNQNASIKGGPYTVSPYPASGTAVVQQYGRVSITDDGTTIAAAFTGYSSDNTARVTLTETYTPPPAHTATLNLTGSGGLTMSAVPKQAATLALTGSGTLTMAAAAPAVTATRAGTGSGQLTMTGTPRAAATLALTGAGTLTMTAVPKQAATLALTGNGALTMAALPAAADTLALSGNGTLTMAGQGTQDAAATLALTGSGQLSMTAAPRTAAILPLTGAGQLTMTGTPRTAAILPLTGSGTLTMAAGAPAMAATLNLTGNGQLTTARTPATAGTLALTGNGQLSMSTGTAGAATLALTGSGQLSTTSKPGFTATINLTGEGALTVSGKPLGNGSLALAGNGTLTMAAKPAAATTLPMAGEGFLTTATKTGQTAVLNRTGNGQLTMSAIRGWITALGLTGTGTLSITGALGAPLTDDHFTGRLHESQWSGSVESAHWTGAVQHSEWKAPDEYPG